MFDRIPSFEKLVTELNKLPGIGPKTAQRLAYYILRTPKDYAQELSTAMQQVHEKINQCIQCFSFTENEEICHICLSSGRDEKILCVVEQPSDVAKIDSSGVFRGKYHVLHGSISPLDGVGPDDLKISALVERVELGLKNELTQIEEIILALDADLEGDTTVLYLAKILKQRGVKITRIAHGVPIGEDIDYVDQRTLARALENRVDV